MRGGEDFQASIQESISAGYVSIRHRITWDITISPAVPHAVTRSIESKFTSQRQKLCFLQRHHILGRFVNSEESFLFEF